MRLSKLSLPKAKFGKNRASSLKNRISSRRSGGRSIYNDDALEKEATTFAEKKTQDLYRRYEKALKERNKMFRGQFAADDPLIEAYEAKGIMLDRKLDRMEEELKILEQQGKR